MVSLFLWFLLSVTQACQCWRTEIACNSGRGQERKPTHFIHASYHYHTTSQKEREREKEGEGGLKKKDSKKESTENPTRWSKGRVCACLCLFLFYKQACVRDGTLSISLLSPFLVSHHHCCKTPEFAAVSKPAELKLSLHMPSALCCSLSASVYFHEVMDC